jgi:hypothetical protein
VPETDPPKSDPGVTQALDPRKPLAQRGEQHEVGPLLVVAQKRRKHIERDDDPAARRPDE